MTQISWLKTIDIYFPTIRKTEAWNKRCHQSSFPLVALKEKFVHASFFTQSVKIVQWLPDSKPVSSSVFIWLCPIWVSLCTYFFLQGYRGPSWIKNDMISRSLTNYISKDHISIGYILGVLCIHEVWEHYSSWGLNVFSSHI